MSLPEVLERISELLYESDGGAGSVTSVRVPSSLKEALGLAVEHLGLDASTTSLAIEAIRMALERVVLDAALEASYREFPGTRPSLAGVAVALAEQDGSPLAEQRELIESAAEELLCRHPDADARDLLLWVEAQQVAGTAA